MNELLSCPFCEGEAHTRTNTVFDKNFKWTVECETEGCMAFSGCSFYRTEAEAIAAWNTRAVESASGLVYIPSFRDNDEFPKRIWASLNGEVVGYVHERTCRLIRHGSIADMQSFVCWSCSECGFGWHHSENDKQFSFCPNCGARVEVEE